MLPHRQAQLAAGGVREGLLRASGKVCACPPPAARQNAAPNSAIIMTQQQREALFDLIALATYADGHISLREEELANSAFTAEGWESEHPKSLFLEQSIARAREAAESDAAADEYIASRAVVFTDHASQTEAYGVVQGVISRDGLATGDHAFLVKLKAAFPKE